MLYKCNHLTVSIDKLVTFLKHYDPFERVNWSKEMLWIFLSEDYIFTLKNLTLKKSLPSMKISRHIITANNTK